MKLKMEAKQSFKEDSQLWVHAIKSTNDHKAFQFPFKNYFFKKILLETTNDTFHSVEYRITIARH